MIRRRPFRSFALFVAVLGSVAAVAAITTGSSGGSGEASAATTGTPVEVTFRTVNADKELRGQDAGVMGTPSFLIDGKLRSGFRDADAFGALLDAALVAAGAE